MTYGIGVQSAYPRLQQDGREADLPRRRLGPVEQRSQPRASQLRAQRQRRRRIIGITGAGPAGVAVGERGPAAVGGAAGAGPAFSVARPCGGPDR